MIVEYIEYLGFFLLTFIARHLPYRTVGRVGAFLGGATFRLTPFRKQVALDNLSKAFPGMEREEMRGIALGAYKNYGIAMMQMLWAGGQSEEELKKTVRIPGRRVINKYLERSGGLILLSGHFGCWEFLVQGLRLHLGCPINPIVQRQRNSRIDALVDATRRRFGNVTIPMGPSSREALKALKEGKIVILLGDQSGPKESVFVNFFGRPSATHRGAAAFSLKTGAPIVMVFLVRQSDGAYEAVFEEVDQRGLDGYTEENIDALTQRHTAILEKYIRMHPDHWLWMHKRWKHTGYFEAHQTVEQVA